MAEIQLKIDGMHCAGCVNAIERGLKRKNGVVDVVVNLDAHSGKFVIDPDLMSEQEIIEEIEKLGYQAKPQIKKENLTGIFSREIQTYRRRFWLAWAGTVPAMLLMYGHMLLGLHIEGIHLIMFVLVSPVVVGVGFHIHKSSYAALKNLNTNMDVLISMGALASWVTGLAAHWGVVEDFSGIAPMIIAFHLTGKFLETKARRRATATIEELMSLEVGQARVIIDGVEKMVHTSGMVPGQVVIVKPGEKIPVDGVVVTGEADVDESMISGESVPIHKKKGDTVIGSTLNLDGVLNVEMKKSGKDSYLYQLIELIEACQTSKVPVQLMADRVISWFVPAIIIIAVSTLLLWILMPQHLEPAVRLFAGYLPWMDKLGTGFSWALFSAIAVLVIACPCALGLATPTAITVASGLAAKNGILFRSGEAIQRLSEITTAVFDKTGTITHGKPAVKNIFATENFSKEELLNLAASVETHSSHPIAKAIVNEAAKSSRSLAEVSEFKNYPGRGIEAIVGESTIRVGKKEFALSGADKMQLNSDLESQSGSNALTRLYVSKNGKMVGYFEVEDNIREESRDLIRFLNENGIHTVMLTGDNENSAALVANQVDIREWKSGLLPEDKLKTVESLKADGAVVLMVGDGINDAPALTLADVGIAMGDGTDIAKESGDVVLIKGNIIDVKRSIILSRATMKKIKQNLFWAFFYNVVMIPMAMLGLLHPVLAESAMALSSINVVTNSLRLRKIKL